MVLYYISQVKRYEEQCDEIAEEVAEVERENLALMEELFESNVEDLKITKYVTQFEIFLYSSCQNFFFFL